MRIRYVVSTMVFWWREHPLSFEQECEFLRSLGYGVELWPTIRGHTDCRYERRNWNRLQEATRDMLVSLNSRNDNPNIEQWIEQIECAATLDAPIVADLRSLRVRPQGNGEDLAFAADVVAAAKERGVQLCLETGSLPQVLKVGEKFDSIAYCLDTGFAHVDRDRPFKEYVDALAERTTYLHLTDNCGQFDDHEPPGARGGMPHENWDYLLDRLQQYDRDIIGAMEMFPCMPGTMIRRGGKFLFDVLGWPNPPQHQPGCDEMKYRPL